jgi:hypothetical protein
MLLSTSKEKPGQPGLHLYNLLRDPDPMEKSMNDVCGAQAHPAALSTTKARGGVTGHHVRYVLGFGLAGIIVTFIIMGVLFGFGS